MANRRWRVAGTFHRLGEIAVIVEAMNWQGALRKGALAIKKVDLLKGRRLTSGMFTLQIHGNAPEAITGVQDSLPSSEVEQVANQAVEAPVAQESLSEDLSIPDDGVEASKEE